MLNSRGKQGMIRPARTIIVQAKLATTNAGGIK
jgi:hypothetical protein